MPQFQNLDGFLGLSDTVVEVVADSTEIYAANAFSASSSVDGRRPNLRLSGNQIESASEFLAKEIWGEGPVFIPPSGCLSNLPLGIPNHNKAVALESAFEIDEEPPAVNNLAAFGLFDRLSKTGLFF